MYYGGYGYGLGRYGFYWDPTYILIIIGAVITLMASARVKTTFHKYSRYNTHNGLTGEMAARRILDSQGLYDVRVEPIRGELTDHYDPRTKVVRLSEPVFHRSSIAAVGVAAHECGHAVQHAKGYVPLQIRSALVPVANFGAKFSWLMIIAGVLLSWNQTILDLGILFFAAAVLFQIVTLPVEINASRRAVAILNNSGMVYEDEVSGVRKVLKAAALTYVAGAASSVLQLLRLVMLFGGRNRD
ncbi:MAG: zinc metallopeptidase [Lachnospiraceae bacterium]|nr:zinc metallopeptidase [Lachnospiraceae bacterium]